MSMDTYENQLRNNSIDFVIDRISKLRTKKGLSARELSMRIGKSPAYISKLECHKNFEPSMSVIMDIVAVCDSSIEEFFYYDMDQYKKDKALLDLIKKLPPNKKESMIEFLSN